MAKLFIHGDEGLFGTPLRPGDDIVRTDYFDGRDKWEACKCSKMPLTAAMLQSGIRFVRPEPGNSPFRLQRN